MQSFHYQENSFKTATRRSRQLMYAFIIDYQSRLRCFPADTDINKIIQRFTPFAESYIKTDTELKIIQAKCHTLSIVVNKYFEDLSGIKLNTWDLQIRKVFPKESSIYNLLFPKGHKPYYRKSRIRRLAYLRAFKSTIVNISGLSQTANDVSAFFTEIETKYQDLLQKQNLMQQLSDKLEKQRIDVAEELYGELGFFMDKFRNNPSRLGLLFNFKMLKKQPPSVPSEVFKGSVAASMTKNITERCFNDQSVLEIENSGTTVLSFWLAYSVSKYNGEPSVILKPGEKKKFYTAELGRSDCHFLNVTNLYALEEGNYIVSILK